MNQSELIEVSTTYLQSVGKTELTNSSGAGLLLSHLQRTYRCPKKPGGMVADNQKTDKELYLEAIAKAVAAQQAAEASEPVTSTPSAAENADGAH